MERVIPVHVDGRRKCQHHELGQQAPLEDEQQLEHDAMQHKSERHAGTSSLRLDFGNASYREYVWEGSDDCGEEKEGSKPKKETMKFGRRWREEGGEKREGSNLTTTTVDASTNVVFESSSRSVKRSKKAKDATRGPKEVQDLLEKAVDEAKGPRSKLDNTSYHEFVWEEGDDDKRGASVTSIPNSLHF